MKNIPPSFAEGYGRASKSSVREPISEEEKFVLRAQDGYHQLREINPLHNGRLGGGSQSGRRLIYDESSRSGATDAHFAIAVTRASLV